MSKRRVVVSGSAPSTPKERFDPNLRMSIYAALIDLGALPHVTQRWVDREHPNADGGFRESLYAYFKSTALDDELLSRIRTLDIPTGFADPRLAAFVFARHETDERFRITSLAGIERCTSLERFQIGGCAVEDFSPLRRLAGLKQLSVSWAGGSVLEAMMNEGVLRELAQRGVVVDIEAPAKGAPVDDSRSDRADAAPLGGISDQNLRLVIFEYLADRGLLPWPEDQDSEMYEYDYEAAAAIGNMVPHSLLASVEELSVSPPEVLSQIVYPQWSGEDDAFAVMQLDGIEYCTKLRYLDLTHCHIADLSPLLGLPALKRVEISWHSDMDRSERAQHRERNAKVIDKLEARGVKVSVKW